MKTFREGTSARLLSLALSVALVFGLMPMTTRRAYAESRQIAEKTEYVKGDTITASSEAYIATRTSEGGSLTLPANGSVAISDIVWDAEAKAWKIVLASALNDQAGQAQNVLFATGGASTDSIDKIKVSGSGTQADPYSLAVVPVVPVASVSLNGSAQQIDTDGVVTLTAGVAPDNATNKAVTWNVIGTSIKLYADAACTDELGADTASACTVYAKGVAAGDATVTVASNADAGKTATYAIAVAETAPERSPDGELATDPAPEDGQPIETQEESDPDLTLGTSEEEGTDPQKGNELELGTSQDATGATENEDGGNGQGITTQEETGDPSADQDATGSIDGTGSGTEDKDGGTQSVNDGQDGTGSTKDANGGTQSGTSGNGNKSSATQNTTGDEEKQDDTQDGTSNTGKQDGTQDKDGGTQSVNDGQDVTGSTKDANGGTQSGTSDNGNKSSATQNTTGDEEKQDDTQNGTGDTGMLDEDPITPLPTDGTPDDEETLVAPDPTLDVIPTEIEGTVGETGQSIVADGATMPDGVKLSYAVKSGSDVIEVNKTTGALTFKKAGTAVVTVTVTEGSTVTSTQDVTVTVTEASEETVTYTCTEGDGSTWTKGSSTALSLTFKRSGEGDAGADADDTAYEHFASVALDGKQLTQDKDYRLAKGSAVVTLDSVFLETLAAGKHELVATFDDGSAKATFTVEEKKPSVTISFDANGGTGAMDPMVVEQGASTKLAANRFTQDGYDFIGWNDKKDGTGTAYADAQDVTASSSMTLYAQWKRTMVTISFDANGGTGAMNPIVEVMGTSATLAPNTFTRDGYYFVGWNLSSTGDSLSYQDGQTVTVFNGTLYAQWRAKDYPKPTMRNSRGGSFTSTSEQVTYTITQKVPEWVDHLRMWVDLEGVLEFTSDAGSVSVRTLDGANVDARIVIDGQNLSVMVDNATGYRGQTLQLSYSAKVRTGADLDPYLNSLRTTASVPYQVHTMFDDEDNKVVSSDSESVKFRLSSTSTRTTSTSTSSSTSKLANTGDPTSPVAILAIAMAGAAALIAGDRRRRQA